MRTFVRTLRTHTHTGIGERQIKMDLDKLIPKLRRFCLYASYPGNFNNSELVSSILLLFNLLFIIFLVVIVLALM